MLLINKIKEESYFVKKPCVDIQEANTILSSIKGIFNYGFVIQFYIKMRDKKIFHKRSYGLGGDRWQLQLSVDWAFVSSTSTIHLFFAATGPMGVYGRHFLPMATRGHFLIFRAGVRRCPQRKGALFFAHPPFLRVAKP